MANKKLAIFLVALAIISILIVSIFMSNRLNETEEGITPADSPQLSARGFFMGFLPVPGNGQSFDEAYAQAVQYYEFSPVWGKRLLRGIYAEMECFH